MVFDNLLQFAGMTKNYQTGKLMRSSFLNWPDNAHRQQSRTIMLHFLKYAIIMPFNNRASLFHTSKCMKLLSILVDNAIAIFCRFRIVHQQGSRNGRKTEQEIKKYAFHDYSNTRYYLLTILFSTQRGE